MANQLKMATVQAILTLHERGWSGRRIADELHVDRGTVSQYVELARQASQPATEAISKPANAPIARAGESAFSKPADHPAGGAPPIGALPGPQSDCLPWREIIEGKQAQGLSARRIHQDLVGEHNAPVSYDSVRRFLRRLGWGATAAVPPHRVSPG